MATWPDLDALKQTLDVSGTEWDGEHHLPAVLAAAIAQVKLDVGDWEDAVDSPDESLSRAAMLLATRVARAPADAPFSTVLVRGDAAYQRLLNGHRRRFAIA